jgi:hypothetical protein
MANLRQRYIDALPPSKRSKPMGFLALGFSRTGLSPCNDIPCHAELISSQELCVCHFDSVAEGDADLESLALKVALEKLDYSVYHMSECVTRWEDKHLLLWQEALQAKFLGQGTSWTGDDIDKVPQNYNVGIIAHLHISI